MDSTPEGGKKKNRAVHSNMSQNTQKDNYLSRSSLMKTKSMTPSLGLLAEIIL